MWNDLFLNIDVNKKAMRLFGIETAVYFSELCRVVKRVVEKGTAVDGYFPLDRKYIEREIGLNLEQQYNCDSILVRNQLLSCRSDSRDWITVDINRWTALITSEDTKVLAEALRQSNLPKSVMDTDARNARAVLKAEEKQKKAEQAELERIQKEEKKKTEAEKREAKQNAIISNMKNYARTTSLVDSAEMGIAIENWVDSIYEGCTTGAFLTHAAIDQFCKKIYGYSADPKIRLELVELATSRGYKTTDYLFGLYQDIKSKQGTVVGLVSAGKVNNNQKIATNTSVDKSVSF